MMGEISKFANELRKASEKNPELEERIKRINNLLEISKRRGLTEEEEGDKFQAWEELVDLFFYGGIGENFELVEIERKVKPNGNISAILEVR